MPKIIFWNGEHLCPSLQARAQRKLDQREAMLAGIKARAARSAGHEAERPLTRGVVKAAIDASAKARAKAVGLRSPIDRSSGALSRDVGKQAKAWLLMQEAERDVKRYRNKFSLAESLPSSAHHTFFCEVGSTHADARSPLLGGAAAGGGTLCYAYYAGAASTAFTGCPVNDGTYAGGAVASTRLPKYVVINSASGPVHCCFWHAQSANNGAIVAQMYAGLAAGGVNFVLFGDLNAEPDQLLANGVPALSIIRPTGGTRISGRCLDYAVSNVPTRFNACRPLMDAKFRDIKTQTGSDHMVMLLDMK